MKACQKAWLWTLPSGNFRLVCIRTLDRQIHAPSVSRGELIHRCSTTRTQLPSGASDAPSQTPRQKMTPSPARGWVRTRPPGSVKGEAKGLEPLAKANRALTTRPNLKVGGGAWLALCRSRRTVDHHLKLGQPHHLDPETDPNGRDLDGTHPRRHHFGESDGLRRENVPRRHGLDGADGFFLTAPWQSEGKGWRPRAFSIGGRGQRV